MVDSYVNGERGGSSVPVPPFVGVRAEPHVGNSLTFPEFGGGVQVAVVGRNGSAHAGGGKSPDLAPVGLVLSPSLGSKFKVVTIVVAGVGIPETVFNFPRANVA